MTPTHANNYTPSLWQGVLDTWSRRKHKLGVPIDRPVAEPTPTSSVCDPCVDHLLQSLQYMHLLQMNLVSLLRGPFGMPRTSPWPRSQPYNNLTTKLSNLVLIVVPPQTQMTQSATQKACERDIRADQEGSLPGSFMPRVICNFRCGEVLAFAGKDNFTSCTY